MIFLSNWQEVRDKRNRFDQTIGLTDKEYADQYAQLEREFDEIGAVHAANGCRIKHEHYARLDQAKL